MVSFSVFVININITRTEKLSTVFFRVYDINLWVEGAVKIPNGPAGTIGVVVNGEMRMVEAKEIIGIIHYTGLYVSIWNIGSTNVLGRW